MKNISRFLACLILLVTLFSLVQVVVSEVREKEYILSKNLMLQADDEVDEAEGMRRNLQTTAMLLIPALILLIGSMLWSYSLKAQVDRKTAELKEEIIKREETESRKKEHGELLW